jgi:hypothetical protein
MTKRRRERRRRLYMTPRKAPAWWPKGAGGDPAEVGVLAGGCGWARGDGARMTAGEIERAKDLIRMDWPRCLFRIG